MNEKLADARQFLSASGWSLETNRTNGKLTYMVFDPRGVARRSFIPIARLLDYARGVFDAQDFNNV